MRVRERVLFYDLPFQYLHAFNLSYAIMSFKNMVLSLLFLFTKFSRLSADLSFAHNAPLSKLTTQTDSSPDSWGIWNDLNDHKW